MSDPLDDLMAQHGIKVDPLDALMAQHGVTAPAVQQQPQSDWQSQVKPVTTFNGKPSVQRPDGGVWYGPDQGNTGQPGWFDAKGSRLGNANGQVPGFMHGLGVGLKNAGEAAAQSFMDTANPDLPPSVDVAQKPIVNQIDAAIAQRTAARNATVSGMMGKLGKFTGEAAPVVAGTVALGGPTVGNWAQRGLQIGAQTAPIVATLTPGSQYDKAVAAVATVPMAVAGEGTTTALTKALPALKDATLAGIRRLVAGDAEQRAAGSAILANATDQGVSLPTSTVIKASVQPAAEVTQARQAVEAFSNDLKQQTANTPFAGLAKVQQAAAGTGKRAVAANSILDSINNAGTDAHDLVKTSAGLQAFREKMRMDQLFALRDELAKGVNVDPGIVNDAIDSGIARLKADDWDLHAGEIKALEALKDRIKLPAFTGGLGGSSSSEGAIVIHPGTPEIPAQTGTWVGSSGASPISMNPGPYEPGTGILGEPVLRLRDTPTGGNGSGGRIIGGTPGTPGTNSTITRMPSGNTPGRPWSFDRAAATRSSIGDDIAQLYKSNNAVVGQPDASILQPIKNAIDKAMSNAAQNSGKPALAQADKVARSEYSNYVGTFRDPTVVKAIQTSDPDQVVQALTKAGTDKAQRIYDALEPKGQAAFAQASWEDSIRQATNKRTGDWIPGNVSGGITDHMKALGVTMPQGGQNAWRLNSINNLMQTLAKVNPEQASALGQRITESAMESTKSTSAILNLYHTVKDGGVDMFFNNKAGKQFLFDAASVEPNSPAMLKLIQNNFPKVLAASSASSAAPTSQEPK